MARQASSSRPTVLLLTHARTASHVLQRMLSSQPNILYGEDWFHPSRMHRIAIVKEAGPIEDIDPAIPQAFVTKAEECYTQFRGFLNEADEQGKIPVAFTQPHAMSAPGLMSKLIHQGLDASIDGAPGPWVVGPASEAHTNPSVMPDSAFLRPGTVPIINFRHPFLIVDGLYRGLRDLPGFATIFSSDGTEFFHRVQAVQCHVRWQRLTYDWYLTHGVPRGIEPILLDADDYLGPDKESLMAKVCDRIPGFDAKFVAYSWSKATSEELAKMDELQQQALKTILASEGVMSGYDMRNRDIDKDMAAWNEEWGQDEAEYMRDLVKKAMPDYEYLMAHRLKP